jgi:hypothetical protein
LEPVQTQPFERAARTLRRNVSLRSLGETSE